VQANTTNWAAVKFWQKVGVTRIILSRELSLDEVEAICNECPDMEIEVFVHGALCIAYLGRCWPSCLSRWRLELAHFDTGNHRRAGHSCADHRSLSPALIV